MMKKSVPSLDAFCARLAEILEADAVAPGTDFRTLPGWCSLQAFGILVFLENDCGVRLDAGRFAEIETVGALYDAR